MHPNMTDNRIKYVDEDISLVTDVKDLSELNAVKSDSYIFLACRTGRLQMDINGKSHAVKEGARMTILPNNHIDNILVSVDADIVMLKLSARIVSDLMSDKIEQWNRLIYIYKAYTMPGGADLEQQMVHYYRLILSKMEHSSQPYHRDIMRSIIRALLLEMLSNMEQNQNVDSGEESRAKFHFNRFLGLLSGETIKHRPLEYYADKLCLSVKYLSVICKKISHKSARQWIDEYTVEDIRYHLFHTDLTLKEIAFKLGFDNVSFFGKYVRRHFGDSPSTVRANATQK